MTATEALYMLERLDRRWSVSDRQLADAECILSDKLEELQTVRRDRRRVYDMPDTLYRVPLSTSSRRDPCSV